ncbi:MAG: hypothetical protein JST40_01695 [Armatimonadetes bacterium]|nr:hypothetical protein [Armatimonadota bacterium]
MSHCQAPFRTRAGAFLLTLALAASALPATRFQVSQIDGKWWLENPAGQRFFSLGVCCVDSGISWSDYDSGNRAYSGFKFYPDKKTWAGAVNSNLRTWGFNTIGAWSDYNALKSVPDNSLYVTPILHMGASSSLPWLDMWSPTWTDIMEKVAKDQIESLGDKSKVIGYFSDNELGWWRPAMFAFVWKQDTPHTRKRVVEFLRNEYRDDWSKLTEEFDPENATSFSTLESKGSLYLRPGTEGAQKVRRILGMLAERYYFLCSTIIKKYDPGALYLGDRYISNYYPEVAEAAAKYCDVVSTNFNAEFTDGTYSHYFLDTLSRITKKPLMVTEYYMAAMENGTGNLNPGKGFPTVQTQAQRTLGFKTQTVNLAQEPSLVGAHWFQYYDEPEKGRSDGENYNFGLVDVKNRPYKGLVEASRQMKINEVRGRPKPLIPASAIIPPAPKDNANLTQWDRQTGWIPPDSDLPRGDLYASWSPEGLHLGLIWQEELFAESYYRSGKLEAVDLPSVTIQAGKRQTTLRFGPEGAIGLPDSSWLATGKYQPGCRWTIFIPASEFGKDKLTPGEALNCSVKLLSETRVYTTVWSISRTLGKPVTR